MLLGRLAFAEETADMAELWRDFKARGELCPLQTPPRINRRGETCAWHIPKPTRRGPPDR